MVAGCAGVESLRRFVRDDEGRGTQGLRGRVRPDTVELTLTILAEKTCDRLVATLPRGNTRLERSAFPQFHRAVSVPIDAGASNTAFPRRSVGTRTETFFASKLTLIQRY
jgi:hypothetical protein